MLWSVERSTVQLAYRNMHGRSQEKPDVKSQIDAINFTRL